MIGQYRKAWIVLGLVCLIVTSGALGQEDTGSENPKSLSYRRVFVPEAELQSQARGLLPMKRDEFESRLSAARTSSSRVQPGACRIEVARYEAAFEENQLVSGEAELEVHCPEDETHWLSLGAANLAISSAEWDEDPFRTAVLGLDPAGNTVLRAERSSQLLLEWSAQGRPTGRGGWQFDLTLPPATRSELQISLPSGWTMSADAGLLRATVSADSVADNQALPQNGGSSTNTIWTLELGGLSSALFSVHPPATDRDDPLLLVSESGVYRLSPGVLDADLSLTLDVHEQAVRSIALRVAPPLDVLSVRYGEERLTWQEGAPDEAGIRRLILELPEPLAVGTHTLQIAATALWPYDQEIAIPRIHVEGGLWQSGACSLTSGSDIRLSPRALRGARQIGPALAKTTSQPSALQFEYFSAAGEVKVVAARPTIGLQVQSGLSVVVDSTQAAATLLSDLSTRGGNRFEFSAAASRRWIIESIETLPAELLEERKVTVLGPDLQKVTVRLRHPVSEAQPVRLIVRARRQRSREGQSLPSDFLRLLTYDDVQDERRLVSVSSTDPAIEPQLIGDMQIDRRDPAEATADELKLFETPPGPIFFQTTSPEAVGRVTLRRGEPRYSAEVENLVDASRNALAHQVRIVFRPESSTISNLLVRASPEPTGEIAWSVENDETQIVGAKPVAGGANGADSSEALWRLQLQRPRSNSVTLVGRWTQPFNGPCELPLFSLPEATSQTAAVQIASTDGTSLRLHADEMFAAPLPRSAKGTINPTLGRFRYEPGRRASLTVSADPIGTPSLNVFVRKRELLSTFSSDGAAAHIAVFHLDNLGADRLDVRLPDFASVEGISIDGEPVAIVRQSQGTDLISVPLNGNVRQSRVELQYSSPGRPQSWWASGTFSAPLPQVEIPCLDQRWIVHLAPALRCWSRETASGDNSSAADRRPFNLFAPADWRALAARWLSNDDSLAAKGSFDDALTTGWRAYEFDLPESTHATITVYRPALIQVIGMVFAVAIFAVASVLPVRRGSGTTLFCLGCLLVLALGFLPPPITPIGWWVTGGVLAVMVWRGLKAPVNRSNGAMPLSAGSPSTTAFAIARGVGALILMVVAIALVQTVHGADGESEKKSPPDHRIVVPIDEDQEPTGHYVYLSEELYEAIHRQAAAGPASNLAWLIRSASYNGAISDDESTLQPRGCELVGIYEIDTFGENTSVSLPLGRGEIHLLESGSMLDGRALTPAWNDDRTALIFDVPQAGRHQVEIRFAVAFQRQDDLYSADIAIPKIAQCKARVRCDSDRGQCAIVTALGAATATDEAGLVGAEVGPAGHLRIEYRPHPKAPAPLASVSVDQRLWWKVRPSSVVADGRFEFTSNDGELREITLRTDPRIKLLPLDSDAGIARQWTEEGPTNTIHLELAPPYPTEASLHATFLFVGAAGSGNLLPPAIEAVAERTTRNWQAVSVTPGWRIEGGESGLAPEMFAQAWGGSPEMPQLAWDRTLLDASPTLSIQPSNDFAQAIEKLDYSLGRDMGRVQYEADIQLGPAMASQFSIATHPSLRVRRVTARAAETDLPTQWWTSADGVLSLAVADVTTRQVRLKVEADWDAAQRKIITLPLLELLNARSSGCEVRVFRRPDVVLQFEHVAGFSAADSSLLGGHANGLGRLVGQFLATDESDRELRLRLIPNSPGVTGQMVTAVYPNGGGWKSELHCALEVRNGVVDTLRFEIPKHWSGPFEIEPAVDHEVQAIPGQSRKQLVVRPQRAIAERLDLVVRAPLNASVAETLRAPDIELLEAPGVDRYIAVAAGVGADLKWETSGLQTAMTDEFSWPTTLTSERFEMFEVVATRFEATARRTTESVSRPFVRLADVQVRWNQDRRYFGTVCFDLHPAGISNCMLAVPAQCELASVTLDGGMANLQPLGERAVRLNLGHRQLPVRVKVAFRGRLPIPGNASAQIWDFPVPHFEKLPVARTLWAIHSPEASGPTSLNVAMPQTTSVQQELERLHSCLAALRNASGSLPAALSASDVRDWAAHWNRYFEQTVNRIQATELSDGNDRTAVALQLHALQSQQRALLTNSEATDPNIELPPSPANDLASRSAAVYLLTDGELPSVEVQYSAPKPTRGGQSVLLSLVALILLIAGVFSRRPVASDWIKVNAGLVLSLLGVFLWLTLPLGPLGWLIVASAAAASVVAGRWQYSPAAHAQFSRPT